MRPTKRWILRAGLIAFFAHPAMAEDSENSGSVLDSLPELPPVQMRGALTYTFASTQSATGQKTMQNTVTATASPSTYIYEPWIATVNGDVNLSQSATSGNATSKSDNLTGTMNLGILPQSDYATEVSVSRYNRSIQLTDTNSDFTGQSGRISTRINLPDEYYLQSRVSMDTAVDSLNQGQDSQEFSANLTKKWVEDIIRLGIEHRASTYTSAEGIAVGANDNFSVRHRSRPFETITTDSSSNLRVSNYQDRDFNETSNVMQGVTTAIWRPKDFYDLTVNGALRTYQESASLIRNSESATRDAQTAYGTLATSYVFMPRLVGNFGLNGGYNSQETKTSASRSVVTNTDGIARSPRTTSMSVGGSSSLDYISEVETISGFSWTWNTGASSDINQDTLMGMQLGANTHIGHTANRRIELPLISGVNMSLSQSTGLGMTMLSSQSDNATTTGSSTPTSTDSSSNLQVPITHSITLSNSSREGKRWDVWSGSFADSRTIMGINPTTYNLLNLQITQGYDPDRFSTLSASLSYQLSRQTTATTDTGMVDTLSGSVTYRHMFIFGVENLNFSSDLSFNPPSIIANNRNQDKNNAGSSLTQTRSTQAGNPSSFGSQRWTNRLDYTIGQMRAGLMSRIHRDEVGQDMTLLFQLVRRF